MSEEEKIEDFEYLYNTMVESIPMIDCYKELYGMYLDCDSVLKFAVEGIDSDK